MEEWLSDPIQMRMAEERQSRRASNANSRAATRTHSRHGSVRMPSSSTDVDSGSSHIVIENVSRFPLSDSTLNFMTAQYLRNLDGGEITYGRDTEDVSQPVADITEDDDDGLFFLEEENSNDPSTVQDRVFMNKVSRSLKMASAQQTNQNDLASTPSSHPPCTQPKTASSRSSMTTFPATMLTRVSLVTFNPSQLLPIVSNKATEKSKTSSKVSFWPTRSHAIANDNNSIQTFHEHEEWGSSKKSNEPTTTTQTTTPSTIRKFSRVLGRLFVKSDVQ